MTDKTTSALKLAEKTLRDIIRVYKFETGTPVTALAAIREALAEPVKHEPVAVISESAIGLVKLHSNGACLPFGTPLYAATVSVEAAVLAEREACAKIAERFEPDEKCNYVEYASAAIRERGEK